MVTARLATAGFRLADQPPDVQNPENVALVKWIQTLFNTQAKRMNEPSELRLEVLYAPPEKPRAGQVVYADGTSWNPGANVGIYVYNGTSWIQLYGGTISPFMRTLLDDTTATAALTTLGIGPTNTYLPTPFNTTNVAASTAFGCTYYQAGKWVTVVGYVEIDPTSASVVTLLGMSLPVASALTNAQLLGGTFVSTGAFQGGGIFADTTNQRASFQFNPASAVNIGYRFIFAYAVL